MYSIGFRNKLSSKILSNQINKFRLYFVSHKHSLDKPKINRWFLTGFTDAEGCFLINIYKNSKLRTGWTVHAKFQIELSENDKPLLKKIKVFLGVGNIYEFKGRISIKFYIQSLKDLAVIIDHFDKYPLITQKLADYKLFIKAVELIQSKEHLTEKGLFKIISIKASMNNGLSEELEVAFPNITPVQRPVIITNEIPDPNWLAGFTEGDGSFFVRIITSNTHKIGVQVILTYKLVQHKRDIALMKIIIKYLDCGRVEDLSSVAEACAFTVNSLKSLDTKIIPFFSKYPLLGIKSKDFADFCVVVHIMKEKGHLTKEGLDKILKNKNKD